VDVNSDGIDDLIALTNSEVVWYESSGDYNFTKHRIGPASNGSSGHLCVYACDLDSDDDIDVLAATKGVGVGWFEQQNLTTWIWHHLDASIGYHMVSATDIELDGDMDVIAVDNSASFWGGDIYLFRNDGSQVFTKECIANLSGDEAMRMCSADFNGDGYPDIYSTLAGTYVFLNDSTGHFRESFHVDYWASWDFDGTWAGDIDTDGDVDLVVASQWNSPYAFYALLNDGTGENFTRQLLQGTDAGKAYTDGGMCADMDMDGLPDIAGTYTKLGWFHQEPSAPLTFTLHNIGALTGSHWVYPAPLCKKCIPSIDLLVTDRGRHLVYENRMLKAFAEHGHLESSILELTGQDFESCDLRYFGYDVCVPNDSSLCFYWRSGQSSSDILTNPWIGPHYVTGTANVVDSFALAVTGRTFQYKVELVVAPADIPVLYEVWLAYECSGTYVHEDADMPQGGGEARLRFSRDGKLVLDLPSKSDLRLTIHDITGRTVQDLLEGMCDPGIHEFGVTQKRGIYFAVLHCSGHCETLKFIR
jgi:hypothetical protein